MPEISLCDKYMLYSFVSFGTARRINLGGYIAEVPPLPIPNRVVKLSQADGTAQVGE